MIFDIIIVNYNYSKYLEECIDSALSQDYEEVNVFVVDDGSTDDSKEIISRYGNEIQTLFQKNMGMMEASNSGFRESSGDCVLFLDADDYLYSNAISSVAPLFKKGVTEVHFRLDRVDEHGEIIGQAPSSKYFLEEGDLKNRIIHGGAYVSVPTSGNVYKRVALEKFFPLSVNYQSSESGYLGKIPTDAYLKLRVPFTGKVRAVQSSLGVYRIHGENNGAKTKPFFNVKKRVRILWTSLDFLAFVSSEYENGFDVNVKSMGPSRSSDILLLRLINLRFDRFHVWKSDTLRSLLRNYFCRFIDSNFSSRYSFAREAIYTFTFIFISILPKYVGGKIFDN